MHLYDRSIAINLLDARLWQTTLEGHIMAGIERSMHQLVLSSQ
jgi:hypothetical protein